MAQSRLMSISEALANNAIAFVISVAANQVVMPLVGIQISISQIVLVTLIFMGISIIRSYLLRRVFERFQS